MTPFEVLRDSFIDKFRPPHLMIKKALGLNADQYARFSCGRRPIDAELARRLETLTGVRKREWLRIQKMYEKKGN